MDFHMDNKENDEVNTTRSAVNICFYRYNYAGGGVCSRSGRVNYLHLLYLVLDKK